MVNQLSSIARKARELGTWASSDPPYQSKTDFWSGFVRGDGDATYIMELVTQLHAFLDEDRAPPPDAKGKDLGVTKLRGNQGTTDKYHDTNGWMKVVHHGKAKWFNGCPIRRMWEVCDVGRKGHGEYVPRTINFPSLQLCVDNTARRHVEKIRQLGRKMYPRLLTEMCNMFFTMKKRALWHGVIIQQFF